MGLKITNDSDSAKAIKVKCTDNDLFRIRPPTAAVKAGDSVTVNLTANVKGEAPKSSHHFVVLHTELGEAENARKAFEKDPGDARKSIPTEFKGKEAEEEKVLPPSVFLLF